MISIYCLFNLTFEKNYWIVYLIRQATEQYKIETFIKAFFQGKSKANLLEDLTKNKYSGNKKFSYFTCYDQSIVKDSIDYERYQTNIYKESNLNHLVALPREKILASYLIDSNSITSEQHQIGYPTNSLSKLLANILFISLEWHNYINLAYVIKHKKNGCTKKICYSFHINNMQPTPDSLITFSQFVLRTGCSLNCFKTYHQDYKISYQESLYYIDKNLLYSARQLLYKKNHQNRWKIRSNISAKQVKDRFKFLLLNWYLNSTYLDTFNGIESTNKKIDNMLYLWQIKR